MSHDVWADMPDEARGDYADYCLEGGLMVVAAWWATYAADYERIASL